MKTVPDNVRFNSDAELVKKILHALEMKGGFCPCRLQKTEDNRCICREFREQIADPEFSGYCYCKLYYKEK